MKRLCILGDSHAAALAKAREVVLRPFGGLGIDLFAGPGRFMDDLTVREGRLVGVGTVLERNLRRTGGTTEIATDYDAYVLYGLHLSARQAVGLIGSFRSERQPPGVRRPLSDACYAAAMAGCLQDVLATRLLAKLRPLTQAPVLLIPTPMPSEALRGAQWGRLDEARDSLVAAEVFLEAARAIAGSFRAELLAQPTETLATPLFTRAEYGREPERFVVDIGDDGFHMNAAYGEVVLRAALERLGLAA